MDDIKKAYFIKTAKQRVDYAIKEIASLKEGKFHSANGYEAAIQRWEEILSNAISELKQYGVDVNN